MARPPAQGPRLQALDVLRSYFAGDDASGSALRSSFGPCAERARLRLWGGGTLTDPERAIRDRLHGMGPQGDGEAGRARTVRAALHALPSPLPDVLYARWGPEPWPAMLDAAFDPVQGAKVVRALGDLIGVALLTGTVARGFALGAEALPRRAAWQTPGGWLVAVCVAKGDGAREKVAKIKAEAGVILAGAEGAYLAALGAPRRPAPSPPHALTEVDL